MSHFFSSAFRATSPVVGIQSHHHFLVAAFRAIIMTSQFDVQSHHHHFFSFGVQSHHRFSVSAFRAVIDFQIDVQSRVLGFGVQSRYHLDRKSVV